MGKKAKQDSKSTIKPFEYDNPNTYFVTIVIIIEKRWVLFIVVGTTIQYSVLSFVWIVSRCRNKFSVVKSPKAKRTAHSREPVAAFKSAFISPYVQVKSGLPWTTRSSRSLTRHLDHIRRDRKTLSIGWTRWHSLSTDFPESAGDLHRRELRNTTGIDIRQFPGPPCWTGPLCWVYPMFYLFESRPEKHFYIILRVSVEMTVLFATACVIVK